jgi:hypothetical protein
MQVDKHNIRHTIGWSNIRNMWLLTVLNRVEVHRKCTCDLVPFSPRRVPKVCQCKDRKKTAKVLYITYRSNPMWSVNCIKVKHTNMKGCMDHIHLAIKVNIQRWHKFGIQSFSIRGRLGLRICTERSCCHGLWEYLSGWVDLVGKPPSPRSFMCWCFGPRVI